METVRQLASYVAATRRPLTPELREAACRSVLDLVAAAAAGIGAPGPRAGRPAPRAPRAAGARPGWVTRPSAGLTGASGCDASAAAARDHAQWAIGGINTVAYPGCGSLGSVMGRTVLLWSRG